MSGQRNRTPYFRPRLEGLEHRLTPSATNLWDGAVNVPPDEVYEHHPTVIESPPGVEGELVPATSDSEAGGQEPLDLGVADRTEIDTQAMDRNVEEVFATQDREPVSGENADIVFAHPEDASRPLEAIDFASATP